jgi:quercetin dioxygenase-like cupin family protein
MSTPTLTAWDNIAPEPMSPLITRQYITGTHTTVARIVLLKDAVVARHSHPNEQISQLLSGSVVFHFDDHDLTLLPGEALTIPPHIPHRVIALQDSVALDIFSPIRQDWIDGTDAYLRG